MRRNLKLVWLLVIALQSFRCESAEMPVLPYPQQVTGGTAHITLPRHVLFTCYGVDAAAGSRLNDNWISFSGTPKTRPVQAVILGRPGHNAKFDALAAKYDPKWKEKIGDEGYLLILNAKDKFIAANSETGLFYGLQSLKQLTRAGWNSDIVITDWPSFPLRGMYDDISRGPISTVPYIKKQIERMAELKINYLSFYIEHVVKTVSHPDIAPENGKLTISDIKELAAYAAQHHMQLGGSFQSFGHFNNILALPQYQSMGETSTMISPLDPNARKFLKSVISELCDAFNSPYFNVNCDETFDLGKGKSKAYTDSVGVAKFYADHIRFLYDVLKEKGKTLMMWGDIVMQHPEIMDMLPKDIIYLAWEYGDVKSFDPQIVPFSSRGLRFMVSPGILNSYRLFADMKTAKANIDGMLSAGHSYGASGALTTVWDDGGLYLFAGDWYGTYVAAEKSWNAAPLKASFDDRYTQNSYGTGSSGYTRALFKLMELRSVPLTFNLSDQLWYQKLLPDSGKMLIVNNSDCVKIIRILNEADAYLADFHPQRNQADAEMLKFSIDQYRLIIDTRTALAGVSGWYRETASSAQTAKAYSAVVDKVSILKDRYLRLRERFIALWKTENQPYWLDVILKTYDKKISDLSGLEAGLLQSSKTSSATGKKSASAMRLNIRESTSYYFQGWLLAGPFQPGSGKFPGFLYSEDPEFNRPPIPGDITQFAGRKYRWQKYVSPNGGVVDFEDYYHTRDAVAYAYCSVNTETAVEINAVIENNPGAILFCNGIEVARRKGFEFPLALKEGINHLILKIPSTGGWDFAFRLDTTLPITNHKHKYTLNPKTVVHDAD